MCQKERGFRGPGFRSAKLTECLALPERQSASAMVLTKANPTMWSIKKEVLTEARTRGNKQSSHKQYNHSVATPLFPPNPGCSVSDNMSVTRGLRGLIFRNRWPPRHRPSVQYQPCKKKKKKKGYYSQISSSLGYLHPNTHSVTALDRSAAGANFLGIIANT
jgi:hypothetical protein